jgi:hypothetical protein
MKRQKKADVEQVTLVREVIASGSVTRLDRCGCGDLYLTVGPITMALHPEALADLSATLGRACAALACGAVEQVGREGGRDGQSESDSAKSPPGPDGDVN